MTILEKIVNDKREEVKINKSLTPISKLEKSSLLNTNGKSLKNKLINSETGIIAEHKRRSPSKSTINDSIDIMEVVKGYEKAGVSGISILTDKKYFGGTINDLKIAREISDLPILRKEFIIDPYQIVESKVLGADAILLIAAILKKEEVRSLSNLAKELKMEVILEVHTIEEIKKYLMPSLDIIGVNNRNLKTFEVDYKHSIKLSKYITNDFLKISESGINNAKNLIHLRKIGYQGFLIGEKFMKSQNPGKSVTKFIENLNL
tara:strand:- start:113 stop:898 length:786 start_codon:yes stop_codon:yes gene_type:complete